MIKSATTNQTFSKLLKKYPSTTFTLDGIKAKIKDLYSKTHTAIITTAVALTVISAITLPIVSALHINLGPLSLYEFYFINILLSKPPSQLAFSGFKNHIIRDIWGILYYASITAVITSALPGICAAIGIILPAINLIYVQASILKTVYTYLFIFTVTCLTSLWFKRAFYEYIGLTPILCSIMFASITNIAFSLIVTNQLAAIVLYTTSLLPLLYFLNTALGNSETKTSAPFMIGITSLSIHIVEAALMVTGLGRGLKLLTNAAKSLSSNHLQAPLLLITTGAAITKCINEFNHVNASSSQPAC